MLYTQNRFQRLSIFTFLFLSTTLCGFAQQTDFSSMRTKISQSITGVPYNSTNPLLSEKLSNMGTTTADNWNTLLKNADRTFLWDDLHFTASAHITSCYTRLQEMAIALKSPGCSMYNNADLQADLINALDWLYTHYYNENLTSWDNWWDFRIGVPTRLSKIVILLYNDLSVAQRNNYMNAVEYFCPNIINPNGGNYTAANLSWIVYVIGMRAIIVGDEQKLAYAQQALLPELEFVTSGDGFYQDGSFLQHTAQPYTGGYGISFFSTVVQLMEIFDGTAYDIPEF